jgi:hypothetical protein
VALKTFGTNATTSLSAFVVGTDDVIAANCALLLNGIRGDPPGWQGPTGASQTTGTNRPRINEAYIRQGKLFVPNRGMLQLKAGDYIVFDATTGWPAVFSGDAVASGPFTHS